MEEVRPKVKFTGAVATEAGEFEGCLYGGFNIDGKVVIRVEDILNSLNDRQLTGLIARIKKYQKKVKK